MTEEASPKGWKVKRPLRGLRRTGLDKVFVDWTDGTRTIPVPVTVPAALAGVSGAMKFARVLDVRYKYLGR